MIERKKVKVKEEMKIKKKIDIKWKGKFYMIIIIEIKRIWKRNEWILDF